MFALVGLLAKLLNAIPGIGGWLRRRIEVEDGRPVEHEQALRNDEVPAEDEDTLADAMQRMLRHSMDQTRSDSRRKLFERMMGELIPDEARIVSALSDGTAYPLVEILAARRGSTPRSLLKNASSIGRAAGVADPTLVPAYVTHLIQRGLVEIGPEDPRLDDDYQILLTEGPVKSAHSAARQGTRRPRVVRETVRISPLGREFWAACQPDNGGI